MRLPLLMKALALGGVVLGLFIGLGMVTGVVQERQGRLSGAQFDLANTLAAEQTLVGPALHRTCTETWTTEQGEGATRRTLSESREFTLIALPHKLVVDGRAPQESRYRGIFKLNGYTLKAEVNAQWRDLSALQPRAEHAGGTLACGAPVLMVALGDARGIRRAAVRVDGAELAVQPGTLHKSHGRGFHAVLPVRPDDAARAAQPLQAALALELVGTGELAFAPLAEHNEVKLSSSWPHPSFGGRFLPTAREIDERGFSATWQISALATTAPTSFASGARACGAASEENAQAAQEGAPRGCIETFGVSFIDPVNPYVLSDRATKYGLLFIVLTFVAVALVEVMRRLRVHPVQYLLVGSALVVFFLLLVSLSEHLPFAAAYAAAAGACTLLLAYYGAHVLRGWLPGLAFGGGIAALYGALYVLLQMEQGSLVLGSVLLFIVLAAVMVVTRRIDWYALIAQIRDQDAPKKAAETPA
ncbi:MAG: cell envelope integrity protein CreD [Aquabacterium sp.]|nr:MAG: cell envelope integrity protein CreD [Aquabacterium sp.]TAL21379.1 MAG: cell envelope integrity protein CreD [Aquabacterium sp.]